MSSARRVAIGIDVGGTGIKGAAVDPTSGERLTARHRVPTPAGGRPADIVREVSAMVGAIRAALAAQDPPLAGAAAGVALPGVLRDGIMHTAANLDRGWIGLDARSMLAEALGADCLVVNDADAAGVAEAALGAARGGRGTTIALTFGTGIGTACVFDGVLVPNFELGHLELDGRPDIERYAAAKAIEREGISFDEWAARAGRYVRHLELLLHPDRFVIGGSISAQADRFLPFPGVAAPTLPARFRNNAGIVGAAWLADATGR